MSSASRVICIAEDRPFCETSLRLLLLSLRRHCGDQRVELFYPPADAAFRSWLEQFPGINLNLTAVPGAWGWNVKPQALLALFDRGYDDVLWIDSDVLITGDFRNLFQHLPDATMVVTEEALYGYHQDPDGLRARLWGFRVGRCLPFTANTAVMRATTAHADLFRRWVSLLESPEYRDAQRADWNKRPPHMYGDQDVLTALLASEEFAEVPIRFLRRGKEIIQFFGPYGYTVRERLQNVFYGMPPFIHSQVTKPWLKRSKPKASGRRQSFDALYLQLSPYTISSREYRRELPSAEWLNASSMWARVLRVFGFFYPPLTGLPLAVISDLFAVAKSKLGRDERTRKENISLAAESSRVAAASVASS